VRVVCQEESRLGLHVPSPRRLTGYGVKPVQVVEPLSESYWLSAAVEPTTGDACWGELPPREAECFPLFRGQLGRRDADRLNLILLDQAPAHVAPRVQWPDNVVLVWSPAYSPAWPPVARLWEDLKGRIDVGDTRVRSSLTALQEPVAGLVRDDTAETIASLTGSAYLGEAMYALSL
jgi:hypothetical protein